ncbi:MAG: hypothetical protein R2794_12665 [Chitinophagales bacterium]
MNEYTTRETCITIFFFTLLTALLIFLSLNMNRHQAKGVIYGDSEGYYMYLPAVFIYHGFENLPIQYTPQFSKFEGTDKYFTKYTYGVSILEAPFFLTTFVYLHATNQASDGYDYPYRLCILFAGIFYCIFGCILLLQFLRKYFSFTTSLITIFLSLFGTNLFYYTIGQPGLSHVYSFFLFSLILFATDKVFKENRHTWTYLLITAIIITFLIRPTNILIVIIPLFAGVNNVHALKKRILFFLQLRYIVPAILCLILVILPQCFYWHYISGKWFLYSYGEEGFIYWKAPKIGLVLFGVWSGWYIYTPLALCMTGSLLYLSKKGIYQSRAILFILLMSLYLFSSWWCWWFGGSFGHRSFVEFYALLSLPLAFLVKKTISTPQKSIYKSMAIGLAAALVYYNIGLTYQYHPPWDGPGWTWNTYLNMLGDLVRFKFVH